MQSKDLRIGNLVTDKYYDLFKRIIEISSITQNGINVYASDDNRPYGLHSAFLECEYDLKDIKPIQLTEEWLLKFGFTEIKPLDTDEHCFSTFCKNGINIDLPYFEFSLEEICKEIKFVHELQNLYFALTGEELELKAETKL